MRNGNVEIREISEMKLLKFKGIPDNSYPTSQLVPCLVNSYLVCPG